MARQGLTPEELRELDKHLRGLVESREFAERIHSTGAADLTDLLVDVQQSIDAINWLKSEFSPHAPTPGD